MRGLLILLLPLLELWLLIKIGSHIGALLTVLLVIVSALVGLSVVRYQGLGVLQRAQFSLARGEAPSLHLLEAPAILVAGALLLFPGFLTDAIGALLLVPALRQALLNRLLRHAHSFVWMQVRPVPGQDFRHGEVIEGEIVASDDSKKLR